MKRGFHDTKPPPRGRYRIKVLEKALAVLELFDEPGAELTLAAVSARLGLNKTTAFRIASVLEDQGYLERAPSQAWRLGFMLHHLGSLAGGFGEIQRRARPLLEELKDRCDETVHLVVLNRGEALYLDKIEGRKAVRVVSRVGMTLPAHCSGVGKVLLAHLPEEEVDAVLRERGLARFTPNTITEREALREELARVRARGYAIDNEEIELGLKCIAAPVRDARGTVIAAVSVSGPKFRFDDAEVEKLVPLVLRAGERISAAMRAGPPVARSAEPRRKTARRDGAAAGDGARDAEPARIVRAARGPFAPRPARPERRPLVAGRG